MKARLKALFATLGYYSGLYNLLLRRYSQGRVAVLCYHDPSPDVFAQHLALLSRRLKLVSLEYLLNSDWPKRHEKSWAVITLDDGHIGNYQLLSLFRRYNLRPTIYVCTGIVDTGRRFWWQAVDRTVCRRALMRLPDAKRKARLREEYNFSEEDEWPGDRVALNKTEITHMKAYVDFEAHTRFHPILPNCDDETCLAEIWESKRDIERLSGTPCQHFSFPNADYTSREVSIARSSGYKSARTADWGWMKSGYDRFLLKAIHVPDDASIPELLGQLCGVGKIIKLIGGWGRQINTAIRPSSNNSVAP